VYKDASANKGGVTSSSLEVLAALAMTDKQHANFMCGKLADDGKTVIVPNFYDMYKDSVIEIIEKNARLEFDCIWGEHERTKEPRTTLTNKLSEKINSLHERLVSSRLWDNEDLRRAVILAAVPKCLQTVVDEKQLFTRVPQNYLKAIFGSHLASMFVYKYGLHTSEFAFMEFLGNYGVNVFGVPKPLHADADAAEEKAEEKSEN